MSDGPKTGTNRRHTRLWIMLIVAALLLAAVFGPPYISIARYKSRITGAISRSFGRNVRLSSVELVLLPRPGFEIHDLVVDEDPGFGAEPILHANTVEASVGIWSLWRRKLEISRISVDEASLNLVRTDQGRWNVDALFRNAANNAGEGLAAEGAGLAAPHTHRQLPTLVATNSRINFKRGIEKLPYSLSNAELNLSAAGPGSWDLSLRGEPVRTDLTLNSGDTGEIRLNATLHNAPELRQMPVKLDLEWRKAQLGQLTRLLLGTDSGWRGDLTGNLTLNGTTGDGVVKSRLRATGVHRAEFAPSSPLDFDANCSFAYHSYQRTIENLLCDSPLGSGQLSLTGRIRGKTDDAAQQTSDDEAQAGTALSFELKNLPAAAGLDVLRTLRASLLPGVEAEGIINGKLTFIEPANLTATNSSLSKTKINSINSVHKSGPAASIPAPLAGSITIDGFELSGGALKQPLKIQKIELNPIPASPGQPQALEAKIPLPAGETAPLLVDVLIERNGYHVSARGAASMARTLEFSQALGFTNASDAPLLSGGTVTADLSAEGPWVNSFAATPDRMGGTAILRNTTLTADSLMNSVQIPSATLHVGPIGMNWDAVSFTYGTLKGTGTFSTITCAVPCLKPEPARFTLKFNSLDAAAIQASLLGARDRGTLVSNLLARLKPEKQLAWPKLQGTIQADSLILGPITAISPRMDLSLQGNTATITGLDATLLGGNAHATGTFEFTDNKPHYNLKISAKDLRPAELTRLFSQTLSGAPINIDGNLKLTGFTAADLISSAAGTLHFDWKKGGISKPSAAAPATGIINPAAAAVASPDLEKALSHFNSWSGDATIASGVIKLSPTQLAAARQTTPLDATIPLAIPARLAVAPAKPSR